MARILALSSQVVSGYVGLSAIVPALQRLGHEVLALPTILLSNHPGGQSASGGRTDPAMLERILETLDGNGRLNHIDGVLSGYLPTLAHVAVASIAIARCRAHNPDLVVLCDPVLGDDPQGVYIDAAAAAALRDNLVHEATILTPNRFELAWLTGLPVTDVSTAIRAARTLLRPIVIATSIPQPDNRLATLAITPDHVEIASVVRRASAQNGTGDLLAALFLAGYLGSYRSLKDALTGAVAQVDALLAASEGHSELQLAAFTQQA